MSYNFHTSKLPVNHILSDIEVNLSVPAPIVTISAEEEIAWREYKRYLASLAEESHNDSFEDDFDWEDWEREEYAYYAGIDELGYSDDDRQQEMIAMREYFRLNPADYSPIDEQFDMLFEDHVPQFTKDRLVAERRYEKNQNHKARTKRQAAILIDSYTKRVMEDDHNFSFCMKRGGRPVKMPKSCRAKTLRLLFQMDKKELFPESHHEQGVELVQNTRAIRKIMNTDRGHIEAYFRELDSNANKRFEHERMMARIERALAS